MNNKAEFDYLDLLGVEVKSVELKGGKKVNCVCVPIEWNSIYLRRDEKTGEFISARQYTREWATNQKYKDACIANHKDDPDYMPPSHHIAVSHTKENEERLRARWRDILLNDATFMATNPTEEDIEKQITIKRRDQDRIGTVTPIKPKEQPSYAGPAPFAASEEYNPVSEAAIGDDLPF